MAKDFQINFNIVGRVQSAFSSAFSTASNKMTALNTRVSSLKAQMKELDQAFRQEKSDVLGYSASYEKLTAELYKAQKAQRDFQKVISRQQQAKSRRDNARASMVGAVETAGVLAAPVYGAMNFESAMSGVAKQVDGARMATGELTDVFYNAQDRVMQASRDMMIMPDTMAKAFTMAAKSGVQGMENIDKFARMGIMMGTAFEAPAEQITEQFAKIGSARGIDLATADGIERLQALADTVNYLDDQSNASGADIITVMQRIAGTATSLIPTLSDTTLAGMSTALLQMGETSETAGTAINSLFTKIAAAPTQSKSFQEALAQIGMTAEELQSNAIKNGEGTIMDLFERIGQLDAGTKNNVLSELFGQEHIDTLSKISGNYSQFIEIIKKGNSEAAKGSMAREFEIQSQNTERQLEGLKASFTRAAVVLSTGLLPHIKTLSGWLSTGATWVEHFSKEHSSLTNVLVTAGAVILGGAVALSAFAWAGWAVIYPVVQLTTWVKTLELAQGALAAKTWLVTNAKLVLAGATRAVAAAQRLLNAAWLASPVGVIIGAVAILAGTAYLLYQNFEWVRTGIDRAWAKFQETFPNAAAILQGIGDKVSWLAREFKNLLGLQQESAQTGIGDFRVAEAHIASNAAGGIYSQGAFLTTFAEDSDEAAIPLDGSNRAVSLWAQAGEMLGVRPGGGGVIIENVTFAPVIQGGDAHENERMLKRAQADFMDQLAAVTHQEKRVSYA